MLSRYLFLTAILLLQGNQILDAATTATATVTYTISTFDAITVSGNPATLTINNAVAGSQPTSATDSTTTYAVTTSNTARKVTGSIGSAMPTGVTLSISLAAPTGGTSTGSTAMSTTAANLVTGITKIAQGSLAITYTLEATVSAASATSATATVTYTIGP